MPLTSKVPGKRLRCWESCVPQTTQGRVQAPATAVHVRLQVPRRPKYVQQSPNSWLPLNLKIRATLESEEVPGLTKKGEKGR